MEQEFFCEECNRKFDSKISLEQHTRDKHEVGSQTIASTLSSGKKFKTSKILTYSIVVLVLAGLGYGIYSLIPSFTGVAAAIGPLGSTHIHADFAVFLDGKQITPLGHEYFVRSRFVHVESGSGEGTVIHMHATNVPMNFFFKSLGMEFTQDCFKTDTDAQYCNSADKTLKMYVKNRNGNWELNSDYGNYVFKDLDKILITYGNETPEQIKAQQEQVTSFSKDNSEIGMPL